MDERIVIVGAGQAGGELEAHPPYQRPPLSKGFLQQGKVALSDLYLKPLATYERFDIELKTGTRVEAIDRSTREVSLGMGAGWPTTSSCWPREAGHVP